MKLVLLALLALVFSVSAQESSFTNGRSFYVRFRHIAQESPFATYWVHTSTNIALPLAQWKIHETFWETNGGWVVSTNWFPAYLPATFFTISSSNEWGVIFTAPFACAPPRAVEAVGLIPAFSQ